MRRHRAGFTLIEVMIAIAIFAIVSLGVMRMLVAGLQLESENAQTSRAISFAQDTMETLRQVPFTSLKNGNRPDITLGGAIYGVLWTVTGDSPAAGMSKVAVTVNWQHKGSPRSYAIESIFADPNE